MRLVPTFTAFAVGGLDGWMRKHDLAASPARTSLSKQWGTYLELGEAALPFIADAFRIGLSREMTDTIGIAGAAMFGDRIVRSGITSPAFSTGAPSAINGQSYVGSAPYSAAYARPMATPMGRSAGFAQKVPSVTII